MKGNNQRVSMKCHKKSRKTNSRRYYFLSFFSILLYFSSDSFISQLIAREKVDYLQANILRTSAYLDPLDGILPFASERFYRKEKVSQYFSTKIFYSGNTELFSVYDDLQSKNRTLIETRVRNSLGKPIDGSAKADATIHFENFSFTVAADFGALAVANDPVFPELDLFIYKDYASILSSRFQINKNWFFSPRFVNGFRKIIDRQYETGELINEKINAKIDNSPQEFFSEFSGILNYKSDIFDFLLEANSLPIKQDYYDYWSFTSGIVSTNFLETNKSSLFFKSFKLFAQFSPFYGGDYLMSRSAKFGFSLGIMEDLFIDSFINDEDFWGTVIQYRARYGGLVFSTYEDSFDDSHEMRSRKYMGSIFLAY